VRRKGGDPVAKKAKQLNPKVQAWFEARERHHLSHAQIQMARELGMNPAKLGKLDNHTQEQWKLPLPRFIEELYLERFGKTTPEIVMSIEERVRLELQKREARRAAKQQRATESG
jgi:hypothetical protein